MYYRDEAVEQFNFPSNNECELCQDDSGELLNCETCPRTFHASCLKRKSKDDFYCNLCEGESNTASCKKCKRKIQTLDDQLELEESEAVNTETTIKAGTELLVARCSLCYDFMHLKCVETPLWLILSGGIYMKNGYDFERAKKIAELLRQINQVLIDEREIDKEALAFADGIYHTE